MKMLLTTFMLLSSLYSEASFNRFWVGKIKTQMDQAEFIQGLNQIFFEETIVVGAGRGLISYAPYITKMQQDYADEIALVRYNNEEQYRAIRATPEGEAYSARHWDYFDKSTSKSTVTTIFEDKLEVGHAYELNPNETNLQNAITYVSIYQLDVTKLNEIKSFYQKLKNNPNIMNAFILITDKFVYEYRMQKYFGYNNLPLKQLEKQLLYNSNLQSAPVIGTKSGINFSF